MLLSVGGIAVADHHGEKKTRVGTCDDAKKQQAYFCDQSNASTDSMVALDQAQDKADGLDLLNTCGQFFDQMKTMIEQYPPLSIFAMDLMQNMVRRFKGGKELDAL
ncbi:MAG: hypothetical protein EBW14_05925, partial [Oxalobacteraceae bacterium]|nr:hypothetical protein [Oxalobacteraceae bacterium]